ncbi:hypothetical protein E2493_04250 [Sphingomonas parva]|uniref:Uncharacterized protein n=1 Tax=Sphingomonas parva TaxID=2555898 RepID=A0A4Y8ZWA3_9SPHN|nr:hypothetical protein [Sphingomonas parva]TFI59415.1 hypothetical protein E2493_04250 [Sphingomonas parva]
MKGWLAALPVTFAAMLLCAAAPPVSFAPVDSRFAAASAEYEALWRADGSRIATLLEETSGLTFPAARIDVIVSEGSPMTTFDGRTIRLRAGYSPAYKKATLVHELGHRLALTLPSRGGLDDHRLLYLFLYDVWTDLYGRDFADRMVAIERRIPGPEDYEAAWTWALALTRDQRQARLRALRTRGDASDRPLDIAPGPPISRP